jgi:hypothetical protein
MRFKRFVQLSFDISATLSGAAAQALACPMCKTNIINAENGAETATTINTAILFLLIPTLALIGWLIKIAFTYRHYHYQNDEQAHETEWAADSSEGNKVILHNSSAQTGPEYSRITHS